jgi:hypothetical protein
MASCGKMQGKLLAFFPDFLKTGGHVGFTENQQIVSSLKQHVRGKFAPRK